MALSSAVNINDAPAEGINFDSAPAAGARLLVIDDEESVALTVSEVLRQEGFREYFDPHTGAGRGVADFSWSAALTLDLLATAPSPTPELRPLTGTPS